MPPKQQKLKDCSSDQGVCSELKILAATVKINSGAIVDLQHAILGNGKEGMKIELSRQGQFIQELISKVDAILDEQKIISEERVARREKDKFEAEQDAKKEKLEAARAANRQWTWRWVLGLVFEKFSVPIVVALVMAALLGGK